MQRILQRLFLLAISLGVTGVQAQQYAAIDTSSQPLSNEICATCHGAYGQGNPVVGAPKLAGMEPWYLKAQLEKFRAKHRGTQRDYIPGYEMQAAVATMSDDEIATVIDYIETWKPVVSSPTIRGDASHGAQLFATCVACHGVTANGNAALGAPALANRSDWYLFKQLNLFKSGFRGSHPDDTTGAQMRVAVQGLATEQDINDVLAYINSLTPKS